MRIPQPLSVLVLFCLPLALLPAETFPSLQEEIASRQDTLAQAQEKEVRHKLLRELGALYQLSGNVEEAQLFWQNAAFQNPKSGIDHQALITSALLLAEMGNIEMASVQARVVQKSEEDKNLAIQADLLLEKIGLLEGIRTGQGAPQDDPDPQRSTLLTRALMSEELRDPRAMIWNYHLYSLAGMHDEAALIAEQLLLHFPESPEALIVQNKTEGASHFSDLLIAMLLQPEKQEDEESVPETPGHEENKRPQLLQTGSFTDRENAEYLARDLKTLGYDAELREAVVNGSRYHRVVIPLGENDTPDQLLIRLKESGYEATPLY